MSVVVYRKNTLHLTHNKVRKIKQMKSMAIPQMI